MNAPPFPLNPSVGQIFGNWAWNGQRWVCTPSTGMRVLVQVFTASGPYMPSAGLVSCKITCVGGGGGGGGAAANVSTETMAGGGGGSGGLSYKWLPASLVAGGVQVTVGAGGAPATADNVSVQGGTTSFGALCVAYGGFGGSGADPGVIGGTGGGAAPEGIGDLTFPGMSGENGYWEVFGASGVVLSQSSPLGGSMFGGNGTNYAGPGDRVTGSSAESNTGTGGGGGVVNQVANPAVGAFGGSGASGICWVEEYCWADGQDDDCLNPPVNVNARVAVTQVPWPGPGPCPPGWGGPNFGPYDADG